ncbi:MAG: sulfotransferase [Gammaproteobacteria bacterium]|nr:sulfotransferase [Gammaproteobacteria bacterium]
MTDGPAELVFVVGASRSGTTLLARVLGLHRRLHALEETYFLGVETTLSPSEDPPSSTYARRALAELIARRDTGPFGGDAGDEDYRQAEKLLGDRTPDHAGLFGLFARFVAQSHGKEIAVEQTPRNTFYAEKLLQRYPRSRGVETVRDPRAVLYSQRRRWRVRFSGHRPVPLMHTFRVIVNYHAVTMSLLWKRAADAGMKLQSHPRFCSIRYKRLVSEPESVLRDLCRFLGFEFEPAVLQAPYTICSTHAQSGSTAGATAFRPSTVKPR